MNGLNTDGTVNTALNTLVTSATHTGTAPGPAFVNNSALGSSSFFLEQFLGDSYKPRVAIGIGVNWNSPFGPFRIDFSRALLKQPGDDPKSFSFNVGTQF